MQIKQPGASIVEISPTYYNSDFSNIAGKSGVYHQYAIGGKTNTPLDAKLPECNKGFEECNGEADCYFKKAKCSNPIRHEFKQPDFEADLDNLKVILTKSIKHLDSLCNGHWPGRGDIVIQFYLPIIFSSFLNFVISILSSTMFGFIFDQTFNIHLFGKFFAVQSWN